MTFSDKLVEFVKAWEGLKLVPSGDPLVEGIVDVGYGHVLAPGEYLGAITKEIAEIWLRQDLGVALYGVLNSLPAVSLQQHQLDALVSLAYNVGVRAAGASTMFRCLRGCDYQAAACEFPRWNRAGGRPVDGLTKRRLAEQAMFEHADYSGRP